MYNFLAGLGIGEALGKAFEVVKEYGEKVIDYSKDFARLAASERGVLIIAMVARGVDFAIDAIPSVESSITKWVGDTVVMLRGFDASKWIGVPFPNVGELYGEVDRMLPDEDCAKTNPLDQPLCHVRNAIRALARGILTSIYFIGRAILWALSTLAVYILNAVAWLAAEVLEKVVQPVLLAVLAGVRNVLVFVKSVACQYLTIAPIGIRMYKRVAKGLGGGVHRMVWTTVGAFAEGVGLAVVALGISGCAKPTLPGHPSFGLSYTVSPYVAVPVVDSAVAYAVVKYVYAYDDVSVFDGSLF